MLPIEYCDLPEELNKVDLYIEGKRWYFEKMPYIYHGLLYLPYREVCHAIGIRPYGGMPDYVPPGTLDREHMITVAWERETNTAYVLGILHYDGYRMISEHLFEKSRLSDDLIRRFFFIDATVVEVDEDGIILSRYEGDSKLQLSNPFFGEITEGDRKRFCFQYTGYSDDIAQGWLMEVAPIREYKRVGFMEYTEKDGKEIERFQGHNLKNDEVRPESPFQRHLRITEKYHDAELYYILGRDYHYGFDTEIDYLKAAECYEKAANTGHVNATLNLGFLYFCGRGLRQDRKKGIDLYKKAAKGGDRIAMTNLGKIYRDGNGVEQSLDRAEDYFMQAVCLGDEDAEYLMALMYKEGLLPDDYNHRNEIMWLRRAASHGSDMAQLLLAGLYKKGKNVPLSMRKAKNLYLTSFSQNKTGSAAAAACISDMYSVNEKKDPIEFEYWMRCSAEIGSPTGQRALSTIYRSGLLKDEEKARYWAEQSEKQGYPKTSCEKTWVVRKMGDKKTYISRLLAIKGLQSLRVDEYREQSSEIACTNVDSEFDSTIVSLLKRRNIYTLGDICRLTEDELKMTRGFGRRAYDTVVERLNHHGLGFESAEDDCSCINGIDLLQMCSSRPIFRRIALRLRSRTVGELLDVPLRRIGNLLRDPDYLRDLIEGLIEVGVPYERRKELNQLLIDRLEQRKEKLEFLSQDSTEYGIERDRSIDVVLQRDDNEDVTKTFSEQIRSLEEDMDEISKGLEALSSQVDYLRNNIGTILNTVKLDWDGNE